ncbi:MAG: MarR family transcriptional regulator [Herpetosiphon sp.]|nr:MarR family transcriptional regulator [Herpetosiphon sp.]
MNERIDHEQAMHYVERVAFLYEAAGMPRMAGRILGWLLICDPPAQNAADLAHVLQASKGSISSMTRLLLQFRLIDRVSIPGDRRDYFILRTDLWFDLVWQKLHGMNIFRQLADDGLALLRNAPAETQQRLEEIRKIYAFFERELPLLLEKWEQERKAQA